MTNGDFAAVLGRLAIIGPDARLNEDHFGYRGRSLFIDLRGQGLHPDGSDSILFRPDDKDYEGCLRGMAVGRSLVILSSGRDRHRCQRPNRIRPYRVYIEVSAVC